jgi:hypothetical protein
MGLAGWRRWLALTVGFCSMASVDARSQMAVGAKMIGYNEAFSLTPKSDVEVRQIAVDTSSATMVDVLEDGERGRFTFHIINHGAETIRGQATFRLVHYRTAVPEGEIWVPHVYRLGIAGTTPVTLDIPKSGSQDVMIEPEVPAEYGGYALVLDIPGHGSIFGATLARIISPEPGRVQFPTYALDLEDPNKMSEGVYTLFQKLGVKGARQLWGFQVASDKGLPSELAQLNEQMGWAKKHDVTVMFTMNAGAPDSEILPLRRPRAWLAPDNTMLKTKEDYAWLPQYDGEFTKFVAKLAEEYGWPTGNLNAVELWNEPWESTSISGWGADIPRYREIYQAMADGVLQARSKAGVKVLIGGTSSSANSRDKLFSDGSDRFLPIFDFASIHYQGLAADPALEPAWMNRKGPYGPVRVWDTESWIANDENRVAGVIASMRAQGQSRTAGIFRGNVYEGSNYKLNGKVYPVVQAYPPAAAVAATQRFIGQRPFREILFHNGLPWVFVFDGLPNEATGKLKAEDGTVVIVGDLAKIYEPERTLFRSVKINSKAVMQVPDLGGGILMFDFYGNPLKAKNGVLTVPLNGLGYFLRCDGKPRSFERLLDAVRAAKTVGIEPVELVAKDLTAPMSARPKLRVSVTNVLNRPVEGTLSVELAGLKVEKPVQVRLAAGETRELALVVEGAAASSNIYALKARFDAGADGSVEHAEEMHVDLIAHRTIKVDGDLAEWQVVLPQVLPGSGIGANVTEQAYLPYLAAGEKGVSGGASTVWLAYDEQNFYFAAKIPDTTPDEGMRRFETRDDDDFFYPDEVTGRDGKALHWPSGVRHFSYRKRFEIPSGTGPGTHDNVQIAFNVLAKKPWMEYPAGTMPRFITYWDTDYEFALNPVALAYGGGTEVWRLLAPGVPLKSFFPREPKSPVDGGPVKTAQVVSRREGDVRIVEAAIPWSEMPEVYKRVQAGETVKFTCRVNDNKGEPRELATGRSVSKANSHTFHDSWQTHWSNEIEFGVQR